jgi:hypothetical protein
MVTALLERLRLGVHLIGEPVDLLLPPAQEILNAPPLRPQLLEPRHGFRITPEMAPKLLE